MYQKRTQEERFQLFEPPIDLSAGKLDAKAAAQGYALAVGLFVGSFLFLMFGTWGIQMLIIDGVIGGIFAMGMSYLAGRSGYQVWSSVDAGYRQYDDYLADVRDMWLDAAGAMQGQPVWTSHSEEEGLQITLPNILALAIAITWQRYHGENKRLWTVDALTGNAVIVIPDEHGRGGERYLHLGKVSAPMAERIGQLFATLGLVEGRRERAAGEWTALTANEAVDTIFRNWSRVLP